MTKWKVTVSKYKRQIKVVIPMELARLAGIHKYKFVEMRLERSGKIIMEGFDESWNRKVES